MNADDGRALSLVPISLCVMMVVVFILRMLSLNYIINVIHAKRHILFILTTKYTTVFEAHRETLQPQIDGTHFYRFAGLHSVYVLTVSIVFYTDNA